MHLCTDLSCVLSWLWTINWAGWAQVVAASVIAWLAVRGPVVERQRQAAKEQVDLLDRQVHAFMVVKQCHQMLMSQSNDLKRLIEDKQLTAWECEAAEARLTVQDEVCASIPAHEYGNPDLLKPMLDVLQGTRLLRASLLDFIGASESQYHSGNSMINDIQRSHVMGESRQRLHACLARLVQDSEHSGGAIDTAVKKLVKLRAAIVRRIAPVSKDDSRFTVCGWISRYFHISSFRS